MSPTDVIYHSLYKAAFFVIEIVLSLFAVAVRLAVVEKAVRLFRAVASSVAALAALLEPAVVTAATYLHYQS